MLDKFYVKHELFEEVSAMNRIPVQYPIQDELAEKYEEINRIQVQGKIMAENKCR